MTQNQNDPTRNARQARRVAELQAAAERDGFASWSTALTAWKRGEYRLVKSDGYTIHDKAPLRQRTN